MRNTVSSAHRAMSRLVEATLRWLTASVFRSTGIFVILTFVPILLLTYYIVATSMRSSSADAIRSDAETRDAVSALLRTSFRSEVNSLSALSDAAPLAAVLARTPPDPQRVTVVLERLLRRHGEFLYLAFYDLDGVLRGSAAKMPLNIAVFGQDALWFQAPIHFRGWYISTMQPAVADAPAMVRIAGPLDTDDQLRGVLVAGVPVTVINGWVRRMSGADHSLYVLDTELHVVAEPVKLDLPAINFAELPAVQDALAGNSGNSEYVSPFHVNRDLITYGAIPEAREIVLVVRPMGFRTYLVRVFYDKLALIALIVFLLAVVSGALLRAAFRYYLRYMREVERGRSKTKALLSSIGDGVFAVDAQLRIIEFNRAASRLTGWRPDDVLGKPYTEVIRLVDEASGTLTADPIRQAIEQRRDLRIQRELSLVRVDGRRIPVAVSAAPLIDEDERVTGCVVVFSDVSQEREVDRMKTEFISIASHQLRTPMSGVKGALALVMEGVLGPLRPEQEEYIRRAYEANERLIALANVLLNIGRLEQGRLQLNLEVLDLAPLVREVVDEYRPRAEHYAQELVLEAPPQALYVKGDRVRLREVFANLVDNAIRYTPEHGRVTVRVADVPPSALPNLPEGSHGSDQVMVEVSDTGVGIPHDKLPQLFQKFSRIPNPLSGRESGSGLGLYFARSVVQLHHGWIDVASEAGRGSTFRVFLPRSVLSSPREEHEMAPAPAQRSA